MNMLFIVLTLIFGGLCLILFCDHLEGIGALSLVIGVILIILLSCTFYSRQFTTIVDESPDIVRGPKGSVNGVIVVIASTEKGCVTAASNDIKWHYIPNSNIVIQANAGYNIWGEAGTNSYEIVVK